MHWLTIPDYVRVSDEEPENEIKVSVERKRINLAPIDNEENVEVIRGSSECKYIKDIAQEFLPAEGNIDLYCSSTGSGKSSRLLKDGLKDAIEKNYRILHLVHRRSIFEQVVSDLSKNKNIPVSYDDGIYTFGNITVTTYQKLHREFEKKFRNNEYYGSTSLFGYNYRLISCDEIHMALEDSGFCQAANESINYLFDFFKRRVSYIFMSATMNGIDRIIYDKACEKLRSDFNLIKPCYSQFSYFPGKIVPFFRKYIIEKDYSNYYVQYMKEIEEVEVLYNRLPEGRKLMVFVSSKESGKALEEKLSDSAFIFAETESEKLSEKARTELENINCREMFDCKCLICTKVIDAGVNIKDDALKDIVIACEEGQNEFIQIIGRKRNFNKSQINLYVMARSKQYFLARVHNCNEKLRALNEISRCNICRERYKNVDCERCRKNVLKKYFSDSNSLKLLDGLFKYDGRNILVNEMSEIKLKITADYYDELISDFDIYGEKAFILKQLSWMGIENQYDNNNYFLSKNIPLTEDDLTEFLKENVGTVMDDTEQMDFREEFEEIAVKLKLYSRRSENTIGISKINQILAEKDLPYTVKSDYVKGVTSWEVIRCNRKNIEERHDAE